MTDHTFIPAGIARLTTAVSLRVTAPAGAWDGGRARMEANQYSLVERWRG